MSKFRYYNTETWKDEWFVGLRMPEQHLWNYLLTNGGTNIAGVYKLTVREMAFDTTIDQEEIKRIFRDRFEPDNKAFFYPIAGSSWVVMKNWLKHQTLGGKTIVAVAKHFNALPAELRIKLTNPSDDLFIDYDTLLIPYAYGIVPDQNHMPVLVKIDDSEIPHGYPMHEVSHNITELNRNKYNAKPSGQTVDKSGLYRKRTM